MSRSRAFHLILASVGIVVLLAAAPAYSQYIRALAIDPQNPTTLYAGTYGGGVFKSTDGGANWSPTSLTNAIVLAMAVDPVTPTTIYAGSYYPPTGVFKSTDGGANWSATGLTNTFISALVIDPLTPTTLYAGTDSGAVFKSTDAGASWNAIRLGPPAESCSPCGGVVALAIDPLIPTTLFGGTDIITVVLDDGTLWTSPGYVFKSTDGGKSWEGGFSGFDVYESVQTLAIEPRTDPGSPTTLYAGTSGGPGAFSGVFKSMDGGVSWNATGLTGVRVYALVIDPLSPTNLYAGTDSGGVFKSADGGTSWKATGLTGVGGIVTLVIDLPTATTLYAGTGGSGVYKSTNSGVSWNNTGLITWPHVSSVNLNPTSAVGGSASRGTVTLSAAAPAAGAVVALSSDNPAIASVPANVTVASGATSADFTVSTGPVTGSIAVTIWGFYGGASNSTILTVTPPATLSSLSLNPTSVVGGSPSTGTVTLSAAAPSGGAAVALSSSNPAVAAVPASVIVPAGAMMANFTVSTSSVTASTPVTIWAANYSVVLTVTPPSLSSLSLNPASVTGGTASTGTVTLSGSAPVGGVTVALSSSNPAVATVPASVTVPVGAANASFTVSTTACTSGAVTISGTYGGVTMSAGLTVATTPDTPTIQQADYFASRRELRVTAKDSNSTATLQVYVTSTGQLIGQLIKGGDGTYREQFTWPTNPQNIAVQSSLCGRVTKDVTLK